ncbi:mandelate racemase/muconate lactonizing enzyme family protein [Arthrobacter sp. MI7-26]|uniref:mandelate racemase/muconate lactonizing enzyme family protein n=1 Tax=Arthrobacter sp. MI7-26 TaxID=2993653 RepID=UPI002248A0A8|nr:mandelate racemase/muconate lactonizing enzyme family protein [Arthrobacter sp. MI7-26]MCX2748736.1 mandelate racemase/muconate lactonizing enzyme family protein [Arthrobacter sp. MI7-26]
MKITGYRSLSTIHDWGRITGDVNGVQAGNTTPVPVLIIETDSGIEGVGLGAHTDIARVFPAIDGEDPRSVVALYDRMLDWVFKAGHSGATFGTIGAVDMALWDIKAKASDEPLWRLLGARERFVPGYASGLEYGLNGTELADLYDQFADRGFKAAKLKGGRDLDRDLPRLEMARDIFSRNARRPAIMLDANESWNHAQAARYIAAIEERMDLTWVEEPLRRWDAAGMAALRGKVRTAIATGENLTGLEQYRPLLDANAVDIVQVGNVWGITHFLRVATLAHSRDLPVSPVAYNANPVAHAAAAVPNLLTFEVQDLHFPVGLDVDQSFEDGGIILGDRPGLGIIVDESQMSPAESTPVSPAITGPHIRPERAALRLVAEPDVIDVPAVPVRSVS